MKRKILLFLSLVLVLGAFNWAAFQKEPLLNGGTTMYLELAPVDPRAFLLGDYMDLDFSIDRDITAALREADGTPSDWREQRRSLPRDGFAVVALSAQGVASFVRLGDGSPLAEGEHILYFRLKNGSAQTAARAFFFQEGHARDYEDAKYGEIHVDADGRHLLTHLLDSQLQRIEPGKK